MRLRTCFNRVRVRFDSRDMIEARFLGMKPVKIREVPENIGAGEGNRTLVFSLQVWLIRSDRLRLIATSTFSCSALHLFWMMLASCDKLPRRRGHEVAAVGGVFVFRRDHF